MQPKKLEHYKFFQPFAWTLCILFATFVGMLSFELKQAVNNLQYSSISIEERLKNLESEVYANKIGN